MSASAAFEPGADGTSDVSHAPTASELPSLGDVFKAISAAKQQTGAWTAKELLIGVRYLKKQLAVQLTPDIQDETTEFTVDDAAFVQNLRHWWVLVDGTYHGSKQELISKSDLKEEDFICDIR
jgi:hypothetical protein